jgi:acetyl-CoA carboxylase carboxyltransferase component
VKKHLRAQQFALENRLPWPTRRLGGAFLPMQAEVSRSRALRPHLLQPGAPRPRDRADRGGDGLVHAGGAYVPAMSDETIIVQKTGTIFLGQRS